MHLYFITIFNLIPHSTVIAVVTTSYFCPAAIGITVDHRRKNRSVDAYQLNVQRLKNYRSRLILFPRNTNKPKKGDSSVEERKLATQLTGTLLPIKKRVRQPKVRVVTEDEKKFGAFFTVRKARITKRLHGKRVKKEQEGKDQFQMF